MPLLTLADAKLELKIDGTDLDTQLQEYVDAAIEAVEFICGAAEPTSVTEVAYVTTNQIVLRKTPVISVQTINGEWAGSQTVGNFYLDSDAGILTFKTAGGARWLRSDSYTVTYTSGRAVAPSTMRQAAIVILKYQWNSIRLANARKTTDETTLVAGLGYALPNAALQMLTPHDRGPAVG